MSETQSYKTVTLSYAETFAIECGLEDRIERLKERIANSHGANEEYNQAALAAAESALAKVVAS